MAVKVRTSSVTVFCLLVFVMMFVVSAPFALLFMWIFDDTPFLMWQAIFMPLSLIYLIE